MPHSIDTLPAYLKRYCVQQEPDSYTPEDHAAWRFIMRQCRHYFDKHGVAVYLDGLEKTGIRTDRIPRIDEIDEALRKFGWGAVPVRGFIPPFAFLELQSRKILPIASDMRQADHILYTPAPDIVHEAAGHAPILVDPAFSGYIRKYANLAKKAIFCAEDLDQYEAIRILSDIKENPDSTPEMIAEAESELQRATDAVPFVSEAAKVARMYWWTAEYGLVGDINAPKIYGAGLLSSVGESQECLTDKVKKIPLSVDCVDQSYDITRHQPQLFVARDLEHLSEVLTELENRMAYKIGGRFGLDAAIAGRTVVTVVLDSGVSVSGKVTEYLEHDGQIGYFRIAGPAQIACSEKELPGQGVAQHPEGFSSPVGNWDFAPKKSPARLSETELAAGGISRGSGRSLRFTNGFQVTGDIAALEWHDNQLVLIKWKNCRVTRGDKTFFEPSWGDFDMLVGNTVTSVYGGAADREKFGEYKLGETKTSPKRTSQPSALEKATYAAHAEARSLREALKSEAANALAARIHSFAASCEQDFRDNWLLRLESLELLRQSEPGAVYDAFLGRYQADFQLFDKDIIPYIRNALRYTGELA
jgi:phenylalanine-4-hydroxylase